MAYKAVKTSEYFGFVSNRLTILYMSGKISVLEKFLFKNIDLKDNCVAGN